MDRLDGLHSAPYQTISFFSGAVPVVATGIDDVSTAIPCKPENPAQNKTILTKCEKIVILNMQLYKQNAFSSSSLRMLVSQ